MPKIIDLHCDTVLKIQTGLNINDEKTDVHVSLNRMIEGNIGVQVFACFISNYLPKNRAFSEAISLIDLIDLTCEENSDNLRLITSYKDIQESQPSNHIGIIAAVENGYAIENDLAKLEQFHQRNVLYMTLTHFKNLDWAASSGENSCDFEGLTSFGEKVVHAMNEMGMIVDVSHVHESTFWDVARISKKPFIASHSNCFKLCSSPRNLTDDQIKAVADKGGMIGINFYPGFLDAQYLEHQNKNCSELFASFDKTDMEYASDPVKKNQALQQFGEDLKEIMKDIHVSIERIVDHIDYIVNLVGDDFVGFGSDFDGIPTCPYGIDGCDSFPVIIETMKKRGYTDRSLEKICFQNFVRVLQQTE